MTVFFKTIRNQCSVFFDTENLNQSATKKSALAALSFVAEPFRIDRPLRNWYHNPSFLDLAELVAYLFQITVITLLARRNGLVKTLPSIYLFSLLIDVAMKGKKAPPIKSLFPSSVIAVQHLTVGLIASLAFNKLREHFFPVFFHALQSRGVIFQQEQDISALASTPGVVGDFLSLVSCTFIPLTEELTFRGVMQESDEPQQQITGQEKVVRTLKASLLFSVMHGSLKQGWTNVLILPYMFSLGLACGLLKEVTGTLWAPTALHIINNTQAMGVLHNKDWKWGAFLILA